MTKLIHQSNRSRDSWKLNGSLGRLQRLISIVRTESKFYCYGEEDKKVLFQTSEKVRQLAYELQCALAADAELLDQIITERKIETGRRLRQAKEHKLAIKRSKQDGKS